MKIQNINNYMNYKVNSKAVKNEEIVKTRKYDVIDIKGISNKDNKNSNDKDINLNSIKKNIATEINKDNDVDKINKIKEAISNNSYVIDTDKIVSKLLK
ncbi:MAG: flagellar biosynthesis anti-sigma factor FlgM [Tissierellia bacterium]|nr:flagellar biosynthesis anti-sigma factor FlgM [Tissierellia bacterium]MDD4779340.1 flagellar biosynthesis anti-sigma factor FlgM [Tissierellia bacterium]